MGEFETYTETEPRVELLPVEEGSLFAEHAVLHFDDFTLDEEGQSEAANGAQSGGGGDSGKGLAVHRCTGSAASVHRPVHTQQITAGLDVSPLSFSPVHMHSDRAR